MPSLRCCRALLAMMIVVTIACAGHGGAGAPAPRNRGLEGLWVGRFQDEGGRVLGSLRIRVLGAGDTAFGYLLLGDSVRRESCGGQPLEVVDGRTVLRFRSMTVTARGVAGWLEPYHDPTLGCRIDTWFEGSWFNNSLAGSYYARPTDGSRTRLGRWVAVRREE